MNYNFFITSQFAKDFKKLTKKNKHLSKDFDSFLINFDHRQGKIISGTGNAYKIRMPGTGTGKRGGYRIIYYFFKENKIYFIKIYSKAIKEDISESEKRNIRMLIQKMEESYE